MDIKKIFSSVVNFFKSGRAKKDADIALGFVVEALPFLNIAATIVTSVIPGDLDNLALQVIKTKYPRLFDGSILTTDELKIYALGIASGFLQHKFPKLDKTIAVLAVQLAYVQARSEGQLPSPVDAVTVTPTILSVTPPKKSPLEI